MSLNDINFGQPKLNDFGNSNLFGGQNNLNEQEDNGGWANMDMFGN